MSDELEDIVWTLLARTPQVDAGELTRPVGPAGTVCPVGGAALAHPPGPAPQPRVLLSAPEEPVDRA